MRKLKAEGTAQGRVASYLRVMLRKRPVLGSTGVIITGVQGSHGMPAA